MAFRIDLSQLADLQSQVREYCDQVRGQVALEGTAAFAKPVYDAARNNAPRSEAAHFFYGRNSVRTGVRYLFNPGNLQAAIYRVYSPERSTPTLTMYRISWNHLKAPYGHMVEYGTSRAPAHPFLRPAMSAIPLGVDAAKAAMARALQEIGRRN